MEDREEECKYCHQEGIHVHTDNRTYVINGFLENTEASKMFDIVNSNICNKDEERINDILEERINKLRNCSWVSDELFFKIRSFLFRKEKIK